MPLYFSSFLLPAGAGVPFLMEDKYIKGGFRSVATIADRDAIRPAEKKAGMIVYVQENTLSYTLNPGQLTTWVPVNYKSKRAPFTYTSPSALANNASVDFTLDVGKAAMILQLTVSAVGIQIEGHSTAARNDPNPYTFLSYAGHLSDDGTAKLDDDTLQYNRRYAFIANLEAEPSKTIYWRIINKSGASLTPSVSIVALELE